MKELIDYHNLPQHVAVVMDGNGRWATKRGKIRSFGHENSLTSIKELVEACLEMRIPFLTLYAFSQENWVRPKQEIDTIMRVLADSIGKQRKLFLEKNIRLKVIGELDYLPSFCRKKIIQVIDESQHNTGLQLIIALSYSGKWDITRATRRIAKDVENGSFASDEITESVFERYLSTYGIPDPELLIRTSGEMRISNFLLWQLAYTELFFTDVLWPDFRKNNLYQAISAFQMRERRFGKTSEQVNQ